MVVVCPTCGKNHEKTGKQRAVVTTLVSVRSAGYWRRHPKTSLIEEIRRTSSNTWVWNRSIIGFGWHETTITFCWRKKPRASCYGNYPMIYKLLSISSGSLCISSLKSKAILTLKFRNLKGIPSLLTCPEEVVGSSVSERTNHGPSPMGLTTRWLNGSAG